MNTTLKFNQYKTKSPTQYNTAQDSNPTPNTSTYNPEPILIDFKTRKVVDHLSPHQTQPTKPKPMGRPKNNPNIPSMPVQPLKSDEQIQQAIEYFLSRKERYSGQNIRDCAIFTIGINVLKRAGDLLNLTWAYVLNENYNIKTHLTVHEQKGEKLTSVVVNEQTKEAITLYYNSLVNLYGEVKLTDPLFMSREKDMNGNPKPMTVSNLYKKMQGLKKELNLNCPIGTHSMRKTLPYAMLRENPNNAEIVEEISDLLGHEDVKTTRRYVGLNQEKKDELLMNSGKGSMMDAMSKFGYSVEI